MYYIINNNIIGRHLFCGLWIWNQSPGNSLRDFCLPSYPAIPWDVDKKNQYTLYNIISNTYIVCTLLCCKDILTPKSHFGYL